MFKPRVFVAVIDMFGRDDGGVASFTFPVQSVKAGKLYKEEDPDYIEDHQKDIVIDDNSCWHTIGSASFSKIFTEITSIK